MAKAPGNVTSLDEGASRFAKNFCTYAGNDSDACEEDMKKDYENGFKNEGSGDGE